MIMELQLLPTPPSVRGSMDSQDSIPKDNVRKLLSWYIPLIQRQAVEEYQAKLAKEETLQRMWTEFNKLDIE
jgi:hypothetical protein